MAAKKLDNEEILTEEELAKEWKCSKRFIQDARANLGLPYFKAGRLIRLKRSEVSFWLEQRKVSL